MAKKLLKPTYKFQFGLDFQEAILNFITTDKKGFQAIDLINDTYFAIIAHRFIFRGIQNFWKRKKRIPSLPLLKETIRKLYDSREFSKLVIDEDKVEIDQIIDKLYGTPVKDGDEILTNIITFARYVNLKDLKENQDLEDFDKYQEFSKKVQKAINIGNELSEDIGMFLVKGAKDRINQRHMGYVVTPTPWTQLNRTLNAGGLEKHSLIMVMAEQKRFKTGMLVNWCRGELGRKKIGAYIDLENGSLAIATRNDQSLLKINKKSVIQGMVDDQLLKTYRKYARIKSELVIRRFSAHKTTALTLQAWFDKLRLEYGIILNYAIVDYGDLMGAISGKKDDTERISDVYLDLKNLAEDNDLDYIITASHVKRDKDTLKRRATKYQSSDVAKCIDKTRHCDMILGLQENDDEKEAGVLRVEIVDQRDGTEGSCLFWIDIDKQSAKEFTKEQIKEYWAQVGREDDGKKKKPEKKTDL